MQACEKEHLHGCCWRRCVAVGEDWCPGGTFSACPQSDRKFPKGSAGWESHRRHTSRTLVAAFVRPRATSLCTAFPFSRCTSSTLLHLCFPSSSPYSFLSLSLPIHALLSLFLSLSSCLICSSLHMSCSSCISSSFSSPWASSSSLSSLSSCPIC